MKFENQFHSSGNGPADTHPLAAAAGSQVPQGPRGSGCSSACNSLELPRPRRQAPGSDTESEPNRTEPNRTEPNRPPIRIQTLGGRSDPNPNLRKPIRSESEPRAKKPIRIRTSSAETDPNPNSGKKRIQTPNPDPNPANASHLKGHIRNALS